MRVTCIGYQRFPRAEGMPRALRALATCSRVSAPAARIAVRIGATSSARSRLRDVLRPRLSDKGRAPAASGTLSPPLSAAARPRRSAVKRA